MFQAAYATGRPVCCCGWLCLSAATGRAAGLPDAAGQADGAQGHDFSSVRKTGPDHHLCADTRDCSCPAQRGTPFIPPLLASVVMSKSVKHPESLRLPAVQMERDGHRCTSIEGSMMKDARDRVVQEFREGTTKVLISTDVLSRGFDVTQVQYL